MQCVLRDAPPLRLARHFLVQRIHQVRGHAHQQVGQRQCRGHDAQHSQRDYDQQERNRDGQPRNAHRRCAGLGRAPRRRCRRQDALPGEPHVDGIQAPLRIGFGVVGNQVAHHRASRGDLERLDVHERTRAAAIRGHEPEPLVVVPLADAARLSHPASLHATALTRARSSPSACPWPARRPACPAGGSGASAGARRLPPAPRRPSR